MGACFNNPAPAVPAAPVAFPPYQFPPYQPSPRRFPFLRAHAPANRAPRYGAPRGLIDYFKSLDDEGGGEGGLAV